MGKERKAMIRIKPVTSLPFKKNRKLAGWVGLAALLVSLSIVYCLTISRYDKGRSTAQFIVSEEARKMQHVMESIVRRTQIVEMIVVKQNGRTDNFKEVAGNLYEPDVVKSIQLAPKGIGQFFYPADSYESSIGEDFRGVDFLNNSKWSDVARHAQNTGNMIMVGPEGSNGEDQSLVAVRPIYLKDARGKNNFWGFTILVFSWQEALKKMDLSALEDQGFVYTIEKIDGATGKKKLLAMSASSLLQQPERAGFMMDDTKWILSITPKGSWIDRSYLLIDLLVGTLVSLLLAILAVILKDFQEEKKMLHRLSMTDTLTGLFNRRKFKEQIQQYCKNPEKPFLICYMDLDKFKEVNDTYGHDTGDLLLQACAKRLMKSLKPQDMLFRIGGDEFVAYIEDPGTDESRRGRIRHIEETIRQPFIFPALELHIAVSIGYVLYPADAKNSEELLRFADEKMYEEKQRRKS
jgi:diguanylate cyclase (GGDEF)-like protein